MGAFAIVVLLGRAPLTAGMVCGQGQNGGSSDAPSPPKAPASAAHGSSCARPPPDPLDPPDPPPDPLDPPDPPPLKPPLDRLDLVTLAEALRMEGPTSSTSIS